MNIGIHTLNLALCETGCLDADQAGQRISGLSELLLREMTIRCIGVERELDLETEG